MSNLGRKGALSSLKLDKVGGEKVTIILKGIITMKENLGILSWSLGEVLWDQDSAWKHTRSFEREEIEAGPSQTILSTQNQSLKDVFFFFFHIWLPKCTEGMIAVVEPHSASSWQWALAEWSTGCWLWRHVRDTRRKEPWRLDQDSRRPLRSSNNVVGWDFLQVGPEMPLYEPVKMRLMWQ